MNYVPLSSFVMMASCGFNLPHFDDSTLDFLQSSDIHVTCA